MRKQNDEMIIHSLSWSPLFTLSKSTNLSWRKHSNYTIDLFSVWCEILKIYDFGICMSTWRCSDVQGWPVKCKELRSLFGISWNMFSTRLSILSRFSVQVHVKGTIWIRNSHKVITTNVRIFLVYLCHIQPDAWYLLSNALHRSWEVQVLYPHLFLSAKHPNYPSSLQMKQPWYPARQT